MEDSFDLMHRVLKDLCAIPAPSHFERRRAEYCHRFLEEAGYENVFIDDVDNVICEIGCDGNRDITVFAAHTDTVFPDMESMPYYEQDNKAYCPGVGDDTASLAVLLVAAKQLRTQVQNRKKGILIVCNSCEEGLGNLKGVRALMKRYRGRIGRFISLDSSLDKMVTSCVGSHRYQVTVKTKGGHSFLDFGQENAIVHLSRIVSELYKTPIPEEPETKTTINVGAIQGGTSVNTIAQSAQMLCEYRSDSQTCLQKMESRFATVFAQARRPGVEVQVELVGDRPCARAVNKAQMDALVRTCRQVIEPKISGTVKTSSGSTDCNIPMSMGVPGVAVGVYRGGGMHTRQEWVELDSLRTGLEITLDLMKHYS